MQGFREFLLRGNVIDLAVGVVVGASFNQIVTSFVNTFLTPVITLLGGTGDFSRLYISFGHTQIHYGNFINAVVSFLIIATVIYFFIVLPMNKLQQAAKLGKSKTPLSKKCPYCFSDIPIKAVKCPHCISRLPLEKNESKRK